MPWLRVDDRMYCNRKVNAVGIEAKCLWLWGMDYSADQLTDGILKPDEVQMLAAMLKITDWQAAAEALVTAGLFERQGDLYAIHDYLVYNPSRDDVIAERKENAEKQEAWRKRKKQLRNPVSNPVSNRVSNSEPVPVPVPFNKYIAPNGAEIESSKPSKRPAGPRQTENLPPMFTEFWAAYPRKKARAEAITAYKKALNNGTTPENLCAGATHYAQECRLVSREDQYVLLPATFVNKRRFEDYQQPPDPAEYRPKVPINGQRSGITYKTPEEAARDHPDYA